MTNPAKKFSLPETPKNDIELQEIMEYHAQFTAKYFCVELGTKNKSFYRFRDWVCEALLGMTSGGYQQLKAIWDNEESLVSQYEKDRQSLIKKFGKQVSELPDVIYIKDLIDREGFNSLSVIEDAVKVSRSWGGSIVENDDFEDHLDHEFEVAILDEFEVVHVYVEFPSGDKYGYPRVACEDNAYDYITDHYTDSVNRERLEVSPIDRGDDGVQNIWYKLERKA